MIASAAVRFDDLILSMPRPARHSNILQAYYRLVEGKRTARSYEIEKQGFLTDTGEFLTREEAWAHAAANKQLLPRAPTDGRGGRLYSEDVWEGGL